MLNNILSILDSNSKKKLIFLILSNIFIGILEMISFSSIYLYIKFILFDELIFENYVIKIYPIFFEYSKFHQTLILSLLIFSLFTFKNLFLIVLLKIESRITEIIFLNIKQNISHIFFRLPFHALKFRYSTDQIINILMKDTEKYKYTLTEFVKISRESIIIASLMILIFLQNFILSLFSIVFFLILSLLIVLYFRPTIKNLGIKLRETDGELIKKSINIFLSIKIIKLFRKEKFFKDDLKNSIRDLEKVSKKFYFITYQPKIFFEIITIFLVLIMIIFLTYYGSDMKEFTPLVTLISATFIRMMPSFSVISSSLNAIKYNEPSVNKLRENIDLLNKFELSKNDNNQNSSIFKIEEKLDVNLEKINFYYNKKIIFKDLNLKISANSFTTIFGKSGSGKSTLLNILSGLIEPSSGQIFINKQNINKNINLWYSYIGYVDQETVILNDCSLLENVAFGENKPNLNLFNTVMKKVNLYNFNMALPHKENTKITEFGKNLSGGQKQRLGIARALYRQPKILLLDEPTSALDEFNETEIFEYLSNLKKEMTIVMVTHKNNAKNYSDRSFEIQKNKLIKI